MLCCGHSLTVTRHNLKTHSGKTFTSGCSGAQPAFWNRCCGPASMRHSLLLPQLIKRQVNMELAYCACVYAFLFQGVKIQGTREIVTKRRDG